MKKKKTLEQIFEKYEPRFQKVVDKFNAEIIKLVGEIDNNDMEIDDAVYAKINSFIISSTMRPLETVVETPKDKENLIDAGLNTISYINHNF